MAENKNALPLGTILNARYEIEGLIGGGGFGLVYRARHTHLNTVVAIKELFPRDIVVRQGKVVHPVSEADAPIYQKVLSSFRKEGRNLASLGSCPSIVQCSDYFEENGTGYLVMEYIEGRSLRSIVRSYRESGKTFSEVSLISLLNELLKGLKEVHKADIQHMDIKPENIYVREIEGADELSNPVLLDFGASRSQTGHSTGSSLLLGTAPYAPIEQMHERGNMGPWADIYALGITLYELMFKASEIPGCTERISDMYSSGIDPLQSAKSRGAGQYSDRLLRLVDKCIEIKTKYRPQNVEEVENLLTERPSLKPESTPKTSREKSKTNKAVGLIGSIIIVTILIAIVSYQYIHIPQPQGEQGSTEPLIKEPESKAQSAPQSQDNQRSANAYQTGKIFRDCATCPEMVVVPAGKFMMGSPEEETGRNDDEGPQRKVSIPKPFAVGKYEVTVGQFAEFIKGTKYEMSNCSYPQDRSWRNPGFKQTNNHPVVCVNWDDASTYAHWLSKKTKHEYRLLTEAEWEYAVRAGTTTAYHFSRVILGDYAQYNGDGTVAVGSFPANAFGLYDMHGNIMEWVEDCWHDDYTDAPTDGSAWTSLCSSSKRVLRGGSWLDISEELRSAFRYWDSATSRNDHIGFRVARTINATITLNTNKGDIKIELNADKAPITVENSLRYAEEGFYDGTIFHQVIPNFMIQGGGFNANMQQKRTYPSIKNEADNGLKNDRGTIAMARTPDPDSASSQFFINLRNNDFLNFRDRSMQGWGYCVFGKVVSGMEVVDKIATVETGSKSGHQDVPMQVITMKKVVIENE